MTSRSTVSVSAPASGGSRAEAHSRHGPWDPGRAPCRSLTHGHVHRHGGVARRQRPQVQVVDAPHAAGPQQRLLHRVEPQPPWSPCQHPWSQTRPPGTAPTWPRLGAPPGQPGWAWWLWAETGLTLGPMRLAALERRSWGVRLGQGRHRGGELPHGKVLLQMELQELLCPPCAWVSHSPHPLLTFHEDREDVSEDGDGGAKDEDGEEEGADGVCNLALGLQRGGLCEGRAHVAPCVAPGELLPWQRWGGPAWAP